MKITKLTRIRKFAILRAIFVKFAALVEPFWRIHSGLFSDLQFFAVFVTSLEEINPGHTVESRFLEPPRETKLGSKNREVREIEGKITKKFIQGKGNLVREIGRFKKLGVKLRRSLSNGNENWFEKSGRLRN